MTAKYEYKGQLLTINELMEFSVVDKPALMSRLRYGWSAEEAVTIKAGKGGSKRTVTTTKSAVDRDINKHNKNLKPRSYAGIPFRLIGEISIDKIPSTTKKVTKRNGIVKHAKNIETHCESCDAIIWRSHAQIRDYGHLINKCSDCRKKEKEEFDQAMINLARRKGLMK